MSTDGQATTRPIGWWLKEADALLDDAVDAALRGSGVDRRGWQVLTSLARGPVARSELVRSLAAFDPHEAVEEVVADLTARGWVDEAEGTLHLSAAGAAEQRSLAPKVDAVRDRVSACLPPDDYAALVDLLGRLVRGLHRHA